MKKQTGFSASLGKDGVLEMLVYGDIVDSATITMLEAWGYPTDGLVSSLSIKQQIDKGGNYSRIRVRINSPGGDAFEGIASYNILRAQGKPVDVYVDALAASSASIIAMAGDTITMGPNCLMMVHNAWAGCRGYATDMRQMADLLDTVSASIGQTYVSRTGNSEEKVKELMDAETWMSAKDCMENGFCTAIAEPPKEQGVAAMAMARGFKALAKLQHVPEELKVADAVEPPPAELPIENVAKCSCDCQACMNGTCADCSNSACMDSKCADCPMQNAAPPIAESDLSLYQALEWQLLHRV